MSFSVIVIAFNEEINIEACLRSAVGWAQDVFVVDSFSTDRTLEIAKQYNCAIFQHAFACMADQRNWALENLPLKTDWIIFLDADEALTDRFKSELEERILELRESYSAYACKYSFYFLGKKLRFVYPGAAQIRVIRRGYAHWEPTQGPYERCVVDGPVLQLKEKIIHYDRKGITPWIDRHNKWALSMARHLVYSKSDDRINHKSGQTSERNLNRFIRLRWFIRDRIPLPLKPLIYFFYTFVIKGGFLDGKAGFAYAFLHEVWYNLLVYWNYIEMKKEVEVSEDRNPVGTG